MPGPRTRSARDAVPLHMSAFAEELGRRLPKDAIIFDEVLTHSPELTRWLRLDLPGQFFQTRGGSLGVGIPGALGIKLAHPERTVIGLTGDGGSMYTIQALWTAAHHRIKRQIGHLQQSQLPLTQDQSARLLAGAGTQTAGLPGVLSELL